MSYRQFDVVIVPFPFTDRKKRVRSRIVALRGTLNPRLRKGVRSCIIRFATSKCTMQDLTPLPLPAKKGKWAQVAEQLAEENLLPTNIVDIINFDAYDALYAYHVDHR